jgi:resuscitation-promoting factor RpfB
VWTVHLPVHPYLDTYPVDMPKLPTLPAERAPNRAPLRRLLDLLALTAVALPLVALAPAGADMDPTVTSRVAELVALTEPPPDAPWDVTVRDGGTVVRGVTTARTVDEALLGLGLIRGPLDRVEPDPSVLAEGTTPLRLVRVDLEGERREVEVQEAVVSIPDPDLLRGLVEVVREGRAGSVVETALVLRVDGELDARLVIDRTVVRTPVDRIQRVGTREFRGGTVWDALARCEASGRWDVIRRVNDRLSYYGGLQFDPRTWDAFRPIDFPALASDATREQQILVAERVLAAQGWSAWPACSQRLGLR